MALSTNNDDFLSAVLLTVAGRLAEDTYFSPPAGVLIPVVSEVREDVVSAARQGGAGGMICIVGMGDIQFTGQSGGLGIQRGEVIVRVREVVATNRGSSGTRENGLRVAQMVARVLNNTQAAMSTDATPVHMGGTLQVQSIVRGEGEPGVNAWHVSLTFSGGSIQSFTRREEAGTPLGSP